MGGLFAVLFGVVSYGAALVSLLYSIAFIGNLAVPKTIDSGIPGPMAEAVLVDVVLLAIFAVQHSVMARPGFKRWWTQLVPASVERSTYVLFASLALILLMAQWRPIPGLVWSVDDPTLADAIRVVFWFGWAVLFLATFLINHFELFGLSQVFRRLAGREAPAPRFKAPALYRHVRHPIYLGLLLGFWATPGMTYGHLLFAAGGSVYILLGIFLEERDLIAEFGDQYRRYREQVSMLIPIPGRSLREPAGSDQDDAAASTRNHIA